MTSRKTIDLSKIPDQEKAQRLEKERKKRWMQRAHERELQNQLGLEYRYIRLVTDQLNMVAFCIGYKRNDEYVNYSVALKSKNDKFNRRIARNFINDRYRKGEMVTFFCDPEIKNKQIVNVIVSHWNSSIHKPEAYGLEKIPKDLRNIPVSFIGW
jgi:hypothetical protein